MCGGPVCEDASLFSPLSHFFSPSCSTNFSNRSGWFIVFRSAAVSLVCEREGVRACVGESTRGAAARAGKRSEARDTKRSRSLSSLFCSSTPPHPTTDDAGVPRPAAVPAGRDAVQLSGAGRPGAPWPAAAAFGGEVRKKKRERGRTALKARVPLNTPRGHSLLLRASSPGGGRPWTGRGRPRARASPNGQWKKNNAARRERSFLLAPARAPPRARSPPRPPTRHRAAV